MKEILKKHKNWTIFIIGCIIYWLCFWAIRLKNESIALVAVGILTGVSPIFVCWILYRVFKWFGEIKLPTEKDPPPKKIMYIQLLFTVGVLIFLGFEVDMQKNEDFPLLVCAYCTAILFYTSTAFLLSWLKAIKVFLITTFLPPVWIMGIALTASRSRSGGSFSELIALLLFGYFLNIIEYVFVL